MHSIDVVIPALIVENGFQTLCCPSRDQGQYSTVREVLLSVQ
jgi:hypothetical protein